jgi:hypothetical protein
VAEVNARCILSSSWYGIGSWMDWNLIMLVLGCRQCVAQLYLRRRRNLEFALCLCYCSLASRHGHWISNSAFMKGTRQTHTISLHLFFMVGKKWNDESPRSLCNAMYLWLQ